MTARLLLLKATQLTFPSRERLTEWKATKLMSRSRRPMVKTSAVPKRKKKLPTRKLKKKVASERPLKNKTRCLTKYAYLRVHQSQNRGESCPSENRSGT